MEFYHIWKSWGGTYGVNKLTLGDMGMAYIGSIVLYIALLGLAVGVIPTILIGFYLLWLIAEDPEEYGCATTEQRMVINILTIISVIYYMVDFHFGWISFNIFGVFTFKETLDSMAIYNLTIGFVSVLLLFVGHDIYKVSPVRIGRIAILLALVFFSYKFIRPISSGIVHNVVTQCSDDESVNASRLDLLDHIRYENGEYVPRRIK